MNNIECIGYYSFLLFIFDSITLTTVQLHSRFKVQQDDAKNKQTKQNKTENI